MIISDNKFLIIGFGVGATVIVALLLKKGVGVGIEVAADAAQAINPLNQNNVINRGFNYAYQGLTGSSDSLGGDIYDITHDGTLNVVNPASEENLINRGFNGLYRGVTGSTGSLGGDLYDWMH